ncbi:SPFH domain-containing protein [Methylosinus sp. Sm6]|uniref:SPFH domain-containing protein n=1 Tax=Methylosinus sp. Sm6 TaxID=2866948 RepID=UPI001C999D24|nr:stomatin-like protein [Methylosinus sp. Sm6]MBY6240014.1 paraslipin [Methylosinus sp. Sm6]
MGPSLLVVGVAAIALLILDQSLGLGLPLGLLRSPVFWFAYVAALALATMVRFVRQQTVLVIERLGRYNRTLGAGVNFVWPIVERAAYTFDLREQVIDVPEQDAITKDNTTVTIDGVLYYKIVNARDAAYGAQDISRAIINLAQTSMRSAIGSMELDKTFENRSEINERVVRAVSDAAQLWGAHVTRYEIKDIAMPESLRQSMERQMKAERDKRATVLESEGVKQSEINRAEGEKQAAILRAEGQARAIELVRHQITEDGGDKAVQLEVAKFAIEQYGRLAKTGNSLVLMGEGSDPAGWVAKAMAVLKTVNASGAAAPKSAQPWQKSE